LGTGSPYSRTACWQQVDTPRALYDTAERVRGGFIGSPAMNLKTSVDNGGAQLGATKVLSKGD